MRSGEQLAVGPIDLGHATEALVHIIVPGRTSPEFYRTGIELLDDARGVARIHRHRPPVKQGAKTLLAVAQGFFGQLALGAIVMHDDDAHRPWPPKAGYAHEKPALLGRRVAGILHLKRRMPPGNHIADAPDIVRLRAAGCQRLHALLQIVHAHAQSTGDIYAHARRLALTGKALPGFVDFDNHTRLVQHSDAARQGIEGGTEKTLRFAQGLFGLLALGDVADGADHAHGWPLQLLR